MHGRTHLIIGHSSACLPSHTLTQTTQPAAAAPLSPRTTTHSPREVRRLRGLGVPSLKHMFPFSDSPSPMDMPLYQQLQLSPSPPSPKPDQSSSFYYYPCSPPFAAAAADASFHISYHQLATPAAPAVIDSPEELPPSMEQPPPAPKPADAGGNAQHGGGSGGLDAASAARKDRHSKICTAGGMRDRRMRLSLDVARKFFALQDMLGFDKASKTVQWLLNTSKAAIQEIMADDAASSECVEDGGSSSLSVDGKLNPAALSEELLLGGGDQQQQQQNKGNGCGVDGKKPPARARKAANAAKPPRKLANAHPVLDKETRAKARERARERTKEKHRMRWVKLASAIDVEAAAANMARDRPSTTGHNLNHSPSVNMASAAAAELEERCSSTLNNGGRMQEVSMATEPSDMILAFGNGGGYGGGSNYCQEQWELGGVVFANSSRFY